MKLIPTINNIFVITVIMMFISSTSLAVNLTGSGFEESKEKTNWKDRIDFTLNLEETNPICLSAIDVRNGKVETLVPFEKIELIVWAKRADITVSWSTNNNNVPYTSPPVDYPFYVTTTESGHEGTSVIIGFMFWQSKYPVIFRFEIGNDETTFTAVDTYSGRIFNGDCDK